MNEIILQQILDEVKGIKAEQQRHGDHIHQLITTVGALGKSFNALEKTVNSLDKKVDELDKKFDTLEKKVDANHKHVISALSDLKRDVEFTYDKTSRNELEIQRFKQG